MKQASLSFTFNIVQYKGVKELWTHGYSFNILQYKGARKFWREREREYSIIQIWDQIK